MTEDTGFPFRPDDTVPAPAPPAEPAADTTPDDTDTGAPETAEDVTEPDSAPASQEAVPFVPSDGVADWLRDAIHDLHRRLTNLGG